jgi:hypothetical protein
VVCFVIVIRSTQSEHSFCPQQLTVRMLVAGFVSAQIWHVIMGSASSSFTLVPSRRRVVVEPCASACCPHLRHQRESGPDDRFALNSWTRTAAATDTDGFGGDSDDGGFGSDAMSRRVSRVWRWAERSCAVPLWWLLCFPQVSHQLSSGPVARFEVNVCRGGGVGWCVVGAAAAAGRCGAAERQRGRCPKPNVAVPKTGGGSAARGSRRAGAAAAAGEAAAKGFAAAAPPPKANPPAAPPPKANAPAVGRDEEPKRNDITSSSEGEEQSTHSRERPGYLGVVTAL